MEARIKNVSTDFTRLLDVKFNHVVKVVTKTETLECNGAVLSQHCNAIGKLIENDNEVFLNDYEFAKDFLKILHGGNVKITDKNCEEIMKFGIQYGLKELTELGLQYLTTNISYGRNSQYYIKICFRASKLAESLGCDFNLDYLWPFEKILNPLPATKRSAFVTDIVSAVGIGIVLDMMKVRARSKMLFNDFVNMIDQTNASVIVGKFYSYRNLVMYAETFSDCSSDQVFSFTTKLESLELKGEDFKVLGNFKACIEDKLTNSKSYKLTFDQQDLLQNWKKINVNELLQLCKVFKTDFYTLEVIMSWVALKRPDWKIVRQICSLLETSDLPGDYMEHAMQVFKTEGYNVSFDNIQSKNLKTELLLNNTRSQLSESKSGNLGGKVTNKSMNFRSLANDDRTVYLNQQSNPTVCGMGGSNDEVYLIFGRTNDGKQIPFYTDFEKTVKAGPEYDFKTLRYYKL